MWDSTETPSADDQDLTPAERRSLGMLPGIAAAEPYEFDAVEGFERPRDRSGQPYPPRNPLLFETEASVLTLDDGSSVTTGGVRSLQHPTVLLTQHPRLWPFWARWSAGVSRDLTLEELRQRSHVEVRAWQIMNAARARADRRELRAARAERPNDDG